MKILVFLLLMYTMWHTIPETVLREAAFRLIRWHGVSDVPKCGGEKETVRTLRRYQNHGRNLRQHSPLYAGVDGVLQFGAQLTLALIVVCLRRVRNIISLDFWTVSSLNFPLFLYCL